MADDINKNVNQCLWWATASHTRGVCEWYDRKKRYCIYFENRDNLDILLKALESGGSTGPVFPSSYPYCDLQGTGRFCSKYKPTGVLVGPHCGLPSCAQLNSNTGRTWVFLENPCSFDRNGVVVDAPIFNYGDISGYGELGSEKEAKCKGDGRDIDCYAYSPFMLGFGDFDYSARTKYSFSFLGDDGIRYYSPIGLTYGSALPLHFKMMNIRATLGKCYWWDGPVGVFEAYVEPMDPVPIDGSDEGVEIGNARVSYGDSLCKNSDARVQEHRKFRFDEELGTYVSPCNGCKPECPGYTSSICWQYCVDEKFQPGDKVLAEQVMELRYYMRRDRWTKESYSSSFSDPTIYAWAGPEKMSYELVPNPYGEGSLINNYNIGVNKVWFEDFKTFNIQSKVMSLTKGAKGDGTENFPTLVRDIGDINELGVSPVIRNTFDKDSDGNNVFEVTDILHKDILVFGDIFYYDGITCCMNFNDPYFKDFFDSFPELMKYNCMLELKTSKKNESEFEDFNKRLNYFIEKALLYAVKNVGLSSKGEKNNYFWIDMPTQWGNNTLFVFNKSISGYWLFDKISVKKIFQGGVIAQKSFKLRGSDPLHTLDYLPFYESNFMTSENQTDSKIEFEFYPFVTQYGSCTVDHIYNDTVTCSQMCTLSGIDARNHGIIYNNEWWWDNRVRHPMPYNPFEYNMAYYGDPDGSIYNPKDKTGEVWADTGKPKYEDRETKWYDFETCYKMFKIPVFSGKITTTVDTGEEYTPGSGLLSFFGNAGYCVITIPEDKIKLSSSFPWGIKNSKSDKIDFIKDDISIIIKFLNSEFDANSGQGSEYIDVEFEVVEKSSDKIGPAQMILKPKNEFTQLSLCDAYFDVEVFTIQKRSFGETPDIKDENAEDPDQTLEEEIEDSSIKLEDSDNLPFVNYRSLDKSAKEYITENGIVDYSVAGEGANVTGAVILERDGISNTFTIRNFDVDSLMISVAFRSDVTGRIVGITRTKMITWVRQMYARDIFISYRWRGDYDLKTWTKPTPEPDITGHTPYQWGTYPLATSYFYPYTGFYPVQNVSVPVMANRIPFTESGMRNPTPPTFSYLDQNDYDVFHGGGFLIWLCDKSIDKKANPFGTPTGSAYDPFAGSTSHPIKNSIQVEPVAGQYDLLYSREYERHELFSPEAFTSSYGHHGFFDARMMGPPDHMVVTCSQVGAHTRDWRSYDPIFWWRYTQPPYPYIAGCSFASIIQGDRIGNAEFIGRGVYMGGVSEADKRRYFGYSEEPLRPTQKSISNWGALSCTYSQVHVFSDVTLNQQKWYPWYMMQPVPLKFGNSCREVLTSFLSTDNLYYGKKGRINAVAYTEVKDRRDRMNDPRPIKTGMLNENSEWEIENAWPEVNRTKLNTLGKAQMPLKRSEFLDMNEEQECTIYTGVDIPDYYYRKWLPVNFSFTVSNITSGFDKTNYPFDIYTTDFNSPYINPLGLYLIKSRENVEMNEHIWEDLEGEVKISKRLRFTEVFRVDKLDLDTYKEEEGDTYTDYTGVYNGPEGITYDKIGLIYPSSNIKSIDTDGKFGDEKRCIFWYVYNEIIDDGRVWGFTDDKKPDDWSDGVFFREPVYDDQIHWAWQEIWHDVERDSVNIINLNDGLQKITSDPIESTEPTEPYVLLEDEETLSGVFSFIRDIEQPDYVYDYELYEHRIVCSEKKYEFTVQPPTSLEIKEPNHTLRFLPPEKDDDTGEYKYFMFFIQLDDGPPRAFNSDGEWDPKELLTADVNIDGWEGTDIYNIYKKSENWFVITCPFCGGTGLVNEEKCFECGGVGQREPVNLFEKIDLDPISASSYEELYIDKNKEKKFFRRGLYVHFNKNINALFSLFPKKRSLMSPDDLETSFLSNILPISVLENNLNPEKGDIDYNSPYVLGTRNVNINYKADANSFGQSIIDISWGETKKLVNKVVLRFTVGAYKPDSSSGEIYLYNIPAMTLNNDLSFSNGDIKYKTEEMTLCSPQDAVSSKWVSIEWDMDRDNMTKPTKGISIWLRPWPKDEELEQNTIIKNMKQEDKDKLVHRVRLESIFIFSVEVSEAVEFIKTYERKYNVSIGSCGRIYPNKLYPNVEEVDELREINPSGKYSNYPSRQQQRSGLSTVYEIDVEDGVVGHSDDTVGPINYGCKCRGRSVGYTADNASPLLLDEGGSMSASSGAAMLDSWEKLQQKNFDKTLATGSTEFSMASVCPPGLMDYLSKVGISSFPSWTLTMKNDIVCKLTPTIQQEPFGSPGPQLVFVGEIGEGEGWCNEYKDIFIPRNRYLELGINNKGCNVNYYSDKNAFAGEDKSLLQAQKEYFYGVLYPNNNIIESPLNYPYPPDCFHTMIRLCGNKWGTLAMDIVSKSVRSANTSAMYMYPSTLTHTYPYPKDITNEKGSLGIGGTWSRESYFEMQTPPKIRCPECLHLSEYERCGYSGLYANCNSWNIQDPSFKVGVVLLAPICMDHPDLCELPCWWWTADPPEAVWSPYVLGNKIC